MATTLRVLADRFRGVSAAGPSAAARRSCEQLAVAGARRHFATSRGPDGTPWPPLARTRPGGGSAPLRDTGLLMASLSAAWAGDTLALSATGPGAALHQYGGTVHARGRFLTIPVTREAKAAGGASRFPRPLRFVRTGARTGLLVERRAGGRAKVQYVCVPAVAVPARPYVGFSGGTVAAMADVLAEDQAKAVARSAGGT